MKNLKYFFFTALIFLGWTVSAKADQYSETMLQKIAPNNEITLNAVKNPVYQLNGNTEVGEWKYSILMTYLEQFNLKDDYIWDFEFKTPELCNIFIKKRDLNDNYVTEGTRPVQLHYQSRNEKAASVMQEFITKIKSFDEQNEMNNYILEDLNLINFYLLNHSNEVYNHFDLSLKFVPEIIDLTQGQNISIKIDERAGREPSISGLEFGFAIIYYQGVAYGYVEPVGTVLNNTIYIPDSTKNTQKDYIKAIEKRIKKSFPKQKIEITYGGSLNDFLSNPDEYAFMDLTQTDGNYYNIKINNITYPFVVMKKEEEKIKPPKYHGKNIETGIQISTTDLNLPLDTIVNVNEITHEKQNQIKEVLKREDFKAFDIQLFSDTLNNHITVLEDGYFEVTIPLGTNYIGKNLVAYYIKNDNTLERHKVTMDAYGNATFETNHFSTYIIAEEEKTELVPVSNEPNPNTYDGITNDLLLAFFSITLFGGTYIFNKKMRKL